MNYSSLRDCVIDLKAHGHLIEITQEVNPNLEMAEIQRRVYETLGPALLFKNVIGSPFEAVSNIYGTNERIDFLFGEKIDRIKKIIEIKSNPELVFRNPSKYLSSLMTAYRALPIKRRTGKWYKTSISHLPLIVSWPKDGGAFITLPQVLTLPPGEKSLLRSNLGMYRIQMSGNEYEENREVGLHYQLHRGIGIHHTMYKESSDLFKVSIFVGGPPAHAVAAIFPVPEDISELTFAGMLGGRRFRYSRRDGFIYSNDADFIITGTVEKNLLKPEGPFGDHLGYYSLKHDFPVLKVENVYHRKDPIWHFTVVGRPPQEDSGFGYLIHKIVDPVLSQEFPGIREIHAVDAAGVHPLLLAKGSERYMPFREKKPEEILTQANHLLGSGQTSLAKYLIIAADDGDNSWSVYDVRSFFYHLLERIDWMRDLHFFTNTTIDTLDYSGTGWNAGSKVIMACCGKPIRRLAYELTSNINLPGDFSKIKVVDKGILAVQTCRYESMPSTTKSIASLSEYLENNPLKGFPLIVLVDDADFVASRFDNFLWTVFTRSNPSHDIYGVKSFVKNKHWGCDGPLIIDARIKPHHAPVLEVDKKIKEKVDRIFMANANLKKYG